MKFEIIPMDSRDGPEVLAIFREGIATRHATNIIRGMQNPRWYEEQSEKPLCFVGRGWKSSLGFRSTLSGFGTRNTLDEHVRCGDTVRLILVRHGETIENSTGISQGHSPGKLTPEGIEQARTLGRHLRGERIDIAFCSDLKRAKDTAAEMLLDRDIPIRYSPLLRERSLGLLQGKPMHELYKAEEEGGGWDTFRPADGETFGDLRNRAQVFLKQLEKEPAESVLVISHGGFLRMMLGIIMGKDMKESIAIPQENTCYNIIEYDGTWQVKAINRTDHLSK